LHEEVTQQLSKTLAQRKKNQQPVEQLQEQMPEPQKKRG
jgi:hypothetical protein